jgi:hypothetical protein
MVRLMVKESIYGSKLVRYMMESGLKVSGMAMGIGRGLINMMPMHYVILIWVSGKRVKPTDMECILGAQEISMKVNGYNV